MICLMPNCAFLSETSRMIQICGALTERGAEVRIATHGGMHEAVLQSAGVAYDIVGPRMDAVRSLRFLADTIGIGDPGQSMYPADEMRAYVHAEADYFRRNSVEAVVTGFTLTTLLSTRIAGVPLVTEHAGSFIPPLLERSQRLPPPRLYLSVFDALADEHGLPRIPSFPALLLGDLSLVTEAPEIYGLGQEEMRAWRPIGSTCWPTTRFEYTGPIFAKLDFPVPSAVEAALERHGPIVYVAITSSSAEVTREIVREAAGTGAEVIVAATIHDLSDLGGPRVTVAGILPSHRIMPRVDLAVTAGGQGSLQCAMAAGTPVIGIPLQPEQAANVRWLQAAGAARSLPLGELGSGALPALIREMTTEPSYRTAARAIRSVYAGRNGAALSAEAILSYLARGRPH